jgi:DNA polymerase-4
MRSVLFIDPPAFCTTVEALVAPALRGRPVAIAPPGADRAVVLALSPEAWAAGIKRGMAVRKAQRMCPDLVLLPPNPRLYGRASRALYDLLRPWAPVLEPSGWGHAYLDLTGTGRLFGPPVDVAARLAREVRERLRLPLTVGVATNKLVSAAAAAVVKREGASPLLVPGGGEAGFLAPHPVALLPGLPDRVRERLDDYQLERIGEVAAVPEASLCAVLGAAGRPLRAHARGIDPRPVLPPERRAELRARHVLATDTNDGATLDGLLRRLTERVGAVLRRRGLTAGRLAVMVACADYGTARAAVPLGATPLDAELWEAARRAFAKAHRRRVAVRELEVVAEGVLENSGQLELFVGAGCRVQDAEANDWTLPPRHPTPVGLGEEVMSLPRTRHPAPGTRHSRVIQPALDEIRSRWGPRAVKWGAPA